MGLRRGPTAHPFGCEANPKAAPSIRLLVLGAAGVLVCVMLLTGWLLWDARRIALEHAAQARDNLAAAIEHDVERTIELYDLSLQAVIDGLQLPGINSTSPEIRNPVLFDGAATARYLGSTMVLDDKGQVTIDSRHAAPPTKISQITISSACTATSGNPAFISAHRSRPRRSAIGRSRSAAGWSAPTVALPELSSVRCASTFSPTCSR